jgi:hypothetical protein
MERKAKILIAGWWLMLALIATFVLLTSCATTAGKGPAAASQVTQSEAPACTEPQLDTCNLVGLMVGSDCLGAGASNAQEAAVCIVGESLAVQACRAGALESLVVPDNPCMTHQRVTAAVVSTACDSVGLNVDCPSFVAGAVRSAARRCSDSEPSDAI